MVNTGSLTNKDPEVICKEIWVAIDAQIREVDFGSDIDREKILRAAEFSKKIAKGKFVHNDRDALEEIGLNPDELNVVTNLNTLYLRTFQFSQTVALNNQDFGYHNIKRRVDQMKQAGLSADEALQAIEKVRMEQSLTAHPTYTGAPDYTQRMGRMCQGYEVLLDPNATSEEKTAAEESVNRTFSELITHHSTREDSMTVNDETDFMIATMKNIRRGAHRLHDQYDRAMQTVYGDEYDPQKLRINLKYRAWGASGDKDGNPNVIDETTGYAIKALRGSMIAEYLKDLEAMQKLAGGANDTLTGVQKKLQELAQKINHEGVDRPRLLADTLKAVTDGLESVYKESGAQKNEKLQQASLQMLRDLDIFELNFAKIEFRETAENNKFVLKNIIPLSEVKKFAAGDIIENRVRSYADLGDLRNIKLESYRDEIEKILKEENAKYAEGEEPRFKSFDALQNFLTEADDQLLEPMLKACSRRDQAVFDKIQIAVTGAVRSRVIDPIMADVLGGQKQYSFDTLKQWKDEAWDNLQAHIKSHPDEKDQITGPGYDHEDSLFYHTIGRKMRIAAQPDMCDTQQLAEATSSIDYLEEMVIDAATGNFNNKISSLFEEPDLLRNVDTILEDTITNSSVFKHITESSIAFFEKEHRQPLDEEIAGMLRNLPPPELGSDETPSAFETGLRDLQKKIYEKYKGRFVLEDILQLEIQFAHSDNTRRGGLSASRPLLKQAHDKAMSVLAKYGIGGRVLEGGSMTDPYRGGMRAFIAQTNAYDTHQFIKFTSQGIDNAVVFSNALFTALQIGDIVSEATVNFLRNTKKILGKTLYTEKTPIVEKARKDLRDRVSLDKFENFADVPSIVYIAKATEGWEDKVNAELKKSDKQGRPYQRYLANLIENNLGLVQQLGETTEYYRNEFLNQDVVGLVMAQVLDAAGEARHGGKASRGIRKGKKKANEFYSSPFDVRTIGFSQSHLQKGEHAGYIGAGALPGIYQKIIDDMNEIAALVRGQYEPETAKERVLAAEAKGLHQDARETLREFVEGKDKGKSKSDSEIMHQLYIASPVVREQVDRLAQALASTDFERIWDEAQGEIYEKTSNADEEKILEAINGRPSHGELEALAKTKNTSVKGMLAWKELEFRKAAELVFETMSERTQQIDLKNYTTAKLRQMIKETLDKNYQLHVDRNDSANLYQDVVYTTYRRQQEILKEKRLGEKAEESLKARFHRARDEMHLMKNMYLFTSEGVKAALHENRDKIVMNDTALAR